MAVNSFVSPQYRVSSELQAKLEQDRFGNETVQKAHTQLSAPQSPSVLKDFLEGNREKIESMPRWVFGVISEQLGSSNLHESFDALWLRLAKHALDNWRNLRQPMWKRYVSTSAHNSSCDDRKKVLPLSEWDEAAYVIAQMGHAKVTHNDQVSIDRGLIAVGLARLFFNFQPNVSPLLQKRQMDIFLVRLTGTPVEVLAEMAQKSNDTIYRAIRRQQTSHMRGSAKLNDCSELAYEIFNLCFIDSLSYDEARTFLRISFPDFLSELIALRVCAEKMRC